MIIILLWIACNIKFSLPCFWYPMNLSQNSSMYIVLALYVSRLSLLFQFLYFFFYFSNYSFTFACPILRSSAPSNSCFSGFTILDNSAQYDPFFAYSPQHHLVYCFARQSDLLHSLLSTHLETFLIVLFAAPTSPIRSYAKNCSSYFSQLEVQFTRQYPEVLLTTAVFSLDDRRRTLWC